MTIRTKSKSRFQTITGITTAIVILAMGILLVEIFNHVFNGCASLSTVSLPPGEIRVATNAFVDCPK